MKRGIDLAGAGAGLILMAVPMLAIGLAIRLAMGSPVLFRQKRTGLNARIFTIYKFRTMLNRNTETGEPLPDEQRLNKLGKLLRRTSLDELPELFNVLKGEMSLVGPRPLLPDYLDLYTEEQAKRHLVKPGLTGWSQINGRNALSWEDKFELDSWYAENWSLWLDIRILLATPVVVVHGRGVNQPGRATSDRFQGVPTDQGRDRLEEERVR